VQKYEWLVFGGGGARCFAYAGALHALKQLGLLGRLRGVSGSSGGAVYALLAALDFSVAGE
jgi:predicted acylesterase/phospholipase RssA